MTEDRPETRLVYESDSLRVSAAIRPSQSLYVVFQSVDGARKPLGGEEWSRFATDLGARSAIFITDRGNTWFNAPGIAEAAAEQIRAAEVASGAQRVVFMGLSMGGFNALVLSGVTKPARVVALAPQWSIDPEVMPDDACWRRNARRIGSFHVSTPEGRLSETTEYVVVHGWGNPDLEHMMRYQALPELTMIGFPRGRHTFYVALRRKKLLTGFLHELCEGDEAGIADLCRARGAFLRASSRKWVSAD